MAINSNTSTVAISPTRGRAGPSFASELRFEGVGYSAGTHPIVNDISFRVKPGSTVCLLGPSGCGKSTTLRLAAGILRPREGSIFLDQQEIASSKVFVPPEKRNIGLMFQDYALFPHMTVLQNVAYGLYAVSKPEALAIASRMIERIGMASKSAYYPASLSGGEQQRVALARALAPRPQIILMDEPFSGLDQRLRDDMRRETVDLLNESQSSAVFVTHDPMEAMEMADEIILMRQGRIVQQGTPEQFHREPANADVVKFFSDVNLFEGTAKSGRVETTIGSFPSQFPDGTKLQVLVRPTAIVPSHDSKGGVEGLVLESRHLGTLNQARLLFSSGGEAVMATFGTDHHVVASQSYRFVIDPAQVYVFKMS